MLLELIWLLFVCMLLPLKDMVSLLVAIDSCLVAAVGCMWVPFFVFLYLNRLFSHI